MLDLKNMMCMDAHKMSNINPFDYLVPLNTKILSKLAISVFTLSLNIYQK